MPSNPTIEPMTSDSELAHRTIIIGDVHGHYDGLMMLMELLAPSQSDQIYFLGDLVDRGPKSCQVVEFVKRQGYACLQGNHEELMMTACNKERQDYMSFQMWSSCGGQETLESYDSPTLLQEHLEWFQTLPTYLDLGALWLVHAGVHPKMDIEEQTSHEFCWIRQEFHQITEPYFKDKLIVTGHTITFTFPHVKPGQIAKGAGWIDIDTGAYHPKSGWLTAYETSQDKVYQVNIYSGTTRILNLDEAIAPIRPRGSRLRLV